LLKSLNDFGKKETAPKMINNNTDKKWTLMFFFASDNTLSPSTLSQLKAIKAAGPHADTNVVVYFDPNEKGAPTRVFEINKDDKGGPTLPRTTTSDGPLVSVLTRDNISPADISRLPGKASQSFASSLQQTDKLDAHTALSEFLGFCHEAYPAEHYMLFLVGHGLVVGRDAFLPDDNPDSAIGLKPLGEILRKFSAEITNKGQALELIGMHSCSMSAVEVAYQLKGTANYMLGSQGLSFVGSWPYRQMLTKIYDAINGGEDGNVLQLMKDLHNLCIHYSVDFVYAGYSADICLCSLDPKRVEKLTVPISTLANALKNGLQDDRCREVILLAHWRSQSYWQETYTDLYDFCLCLRRLCNEPEREHQEDKPRRFVKRDYDVKRLAIIEACTQVITTLRPSNGQQVNGPVELIDFIGPDCQYSHGLSIYFPWSKPLEDENDQVLANYKNYMFTHDLRVGVVSWLDFLESYFEKTKREDRLTEERKFKDEDTRYQDDPAYKQALALARSSFEPALVGFGGSDVIPTAVLEGKISPPDAGGGACTCASTKNYSRELSMSEGVSTVFGVPKSQTAGAP
jgi:hypothetical protein